MFSSSIRTFIPVIKRPLALQTRIVTANGGFRQVAASPSLAAADISVGWSRHRGRKRRASPLPPSASSLFHAQRRTNSPSHCLKSRFFRRSMTSSGIVSIPVIKRPRDLLIRISCASLEPAERLSRCHGSGEHQFVELIIGFRRGQVGNCREPAHYFFSA
jgi:hypothetical protein